MASAAGTRVGIAKWRKVEPLLRSVSLPQSWHLHEGCLFFRSSGPCGEGQRQCQSTPTPNGDDINRRHDHLRRAPMVVEPSCTSRSSFFCNEEAEADDHVDVTEHAWSTSTSRPTEPFPSARRTPAVRVAAFDFDRTILHFGGSGSGADTSRRDALCENLFLQQRCWLDPSVVAALRELLLEKNYKVVVFSNQNVLRKVSNLDECQDAVDRCIKRFSKFQQALDALLRTGAAAAAPSTTAAQAGLTPLGCSASIELYLALGRGDSGDWYRKPKPGMWQLFCSEREESIIGRNGSGTRMEKQKLNVDYENSFFVGNAAGRALDRTDFDRHFAETVGLRFFTEEFFQKYAAAAGGGAGHQDQTGTAGREVGGSPLRV